MAKTIYFAGSIRGGRDDADLYRQIIEYLEQYGTVLTEHVGDKNLSTAGEKTLSSLSIHNRDMDWLMQADVVVAEVTTASLGVGYELGRAVENNKKILCLFRQDDDKKLSAMIAGCPQIVNQAYQTFDQAKTIIDQFFQFLS
ncbi:MAG: nucleoside 2-deoxyribosyltransferase [Candidatus Buchananbacteria bacterium]|nr:nucleoside 2-deoxyribosyltransferase [Candidatus Buchananbacteria bacterium]